MEGTAVGSTVAEEHDRNIVVLQNHFAGQRCAGRQVVAAADDAVGAQHTDGEVRNVHAAALALAEAVLLAEDFCHHFIYIRSLGNAMAMAAVSTLNKICLAQCSADACGNGFLTDIQVNEARNLAVQEVLLYRLLKAANGAHGLVELFCLLFGYFRQCSHTFLKK